jgi:hypothetical protein
MANEGVGVGRQAALFDDDGVKRQAVLFDYVDDGIDVELDTDDEDRAIR